METASAPNGASTGKRGWKERLLHELREYAITAAYLYVWLLALLLYKTALLREEGLAFLPLGLAAGKALILGKFVLLGEKVEVGSRLGARTLLHRIAWRVLSLLLLLIALTVLEEFVVGWVHGRSAAQTLAEFETHSVLETAAKCLLLLLVLVPFIVAKQASLALGPGRLRGMLLSAERAVTGDGSR